MKIRPHIRNEKGKLVPIGYKELSRLQDNDPDIEVVHKLCNVPKDGVSWGALADFIDDLIYYRNKNAPSLFKTENQRAQVLASFDKYRKYIEEG